MGAKPKVCIVGNCQAQALTSLSRHLDSPLDVVTLPPVFDVSNFRKTEIEKEVYGADFVFCQRVSDNYVVEFVRPQEIKGALGDRAVLWPNVYFDGYFPSIGYIYDDFGKVTGPLSDYHFQAVRSAWRAGVEPQNATSGLLSGTLQGLSPNPVEQSLAELRVKEEGLDIQISDYISAHFRWRKLFYSMNHPNNDLLVEVLRRMTDRMDIGLGQINSVSSYPYPLNKIDIPCFDYIRKNYRLEFATQQIKGCSINLTSSGGKIGEIDQIEYYEWFDLISKFYALYDRLADEVSGDS